MSDKQSSSSEPTLESIDLGSFLTGTENRQRKIAKKVDKICRSIGFLVIENHGVSADIVDTAWVKVREFFDLPLEAKMRLRSEDPGCPRGYFPLESETLAKSRHVNTPPDVKESFSIGPMRAPKDSFAVGEFEFHYGENFWPDEPQGFREALSGYFHEMETLGNRILQLFAIALELPLDYFKRFHTYPMCALRCLSYPYSNRVLLPQQRGAGAHSDYGSLTILKPDSAVPGLEVKLPTGDWRPAPTVVDGFIINIGDLMARWTNDRWTSTMHRVVNPGGPDGGDCQRQSIAFFHNTNYDAEIHCIPTCSGDISRHEPIFAGDYLKQRFYAASGGESNPKGLKDY